MQEFLLDPLDGPFVIVPCASRRGVQGDFWVRVATESDFELSPVILPTPNAEQAAAMAPYKVPTYCLHCKKQLPEVTEETFVVEDGKVHSECYQAFKMANSDVCVQCKKPIISGKVVVIEGKKVGPYDLFCSHSVATAVLPIGAPLVTRALVCSSRFPDCSSTRLAMTLTVRPTARSAPSARSQSARISSRWMAAPSHAARSAQTSGMRTIEHGIASRTESTRIVC